MKGPASFLRYWVPARFAARTDGIEWIYTGVQPYTDPFFDETLIKCAGLDKNRKRFKCFSSSEMMVDWSHHLESLAPSAFIFHVSRCGSTLMTQSLVGSTANICLSEVPFFDEILRRPLAADTPIDIAACLPAAIAFYGQQRTGEETKLFVKTDSWHLMFYETLRKCYPSTPFIVLYRNPSEVILSQRRRAGLHAVPGLLPAEIFGFGADAHEHPHHYLDAVLCSYFEKIKSIVSKDDRTLLLNYKEGIEAIMEKTGRFTNASLTGEDLQRIRQRSAYHAKYPTEVFSEATVPSEAADPSGSPELMKLYEEVETLRLAKEGGGG